MTEHEDSKELYEYIIYITKFNQELMDLNIKYSEEIERLNNIINELEKWLKNKIDNFDRIVLDITYHEQITIQLIYDYLQELKGSDKDD